MFSPSILREKWVFENRNNGSRSGTHQQLSTVKCSISCQQQVVLMLSESLHGLFNKSNSSQTNNASTKEVARLSQFNPVPDARSEATFHVMHNPMWMT